MQEFCRILFLIYSHSCGNLARDVLYKPRSTPHSLVLNYCHRCWQEVTQLYLLELVSLFFFFFFFNFHLVSSSLRQKETTVESPEIKKHVQCWVMSSGGLGVRSPHGVSWQDDRTLRTGIHISPCRKLCNSCWHRLISETAAWLALSVPITLTPCTWQRTH